MADKNLEIVVNDENFDQEVLKSNVPVLVDFWAEWCGPCRMIPPLVSEIAVEYKDKLKVCKLNVEEGRQTSTNYGIMSIPTIIIFKNGEIVDKVVGAVPKNDLVSRINAHV